jgi:hypothetical protein
MAATGAAVSRRAWSVGLLVAALSLVGGRARAEDLRPRPEDRVDVCADPRRVDLGPLPGGIDVADWGAIPESCAGTDLAMRLRGSALVASAGPDYFGDVVATSTLRLRHQLGRSSPAWLSLAADLLTYRYVVNGAVQSQGFGFGPVTLGLHRSVLAWPRSATTVYGRALLPLDTARQGGVRTGVEAGVTGRHLLGARGRGGLQGGVAALVPIDIVGGQEHAAFQASALGEVWYRATPRFAMFAGAELRAEISPEPTFLTLAPRVAGRWALSHGLNLAALVEVPAVGSDRTDIIAAFTVGWAAAD